MAKNGTEFSKYAQAFREVIDGNKTYKTILTKDLLKMGLTNLDKDYINTKYPTYTDNIGKRHIKDNKGSGLLKYFEGANDLSNLIPDLETEFDEEFRERYCEELQDYNESRIMAFAQVLNIDVNEDDIDIVSEAIAEYYSSIVIGSATKKSRKSKTIEEKSNNTKESNEIVRKYTLRPEEKTTISAILSYIDNCLYKLKANAEKYNSLDNEIKNGTVTEIQGLTDEMMIGFTEAEKEYQRKNVKAINEDTKRRFKEAAESQKISLKKDFDSFYSKLNELFSDLKIMVSNKSESDRYIKMLNDIADYFGNNKIEIDKYFNPVTLSKINDFEKCVKYLKKE